MSKQALLRRRFAQSVAMRVEHLSAWVGAAERDLDGALYFDADDARVMDIARMLRLKLKAQDYAIPPELMQRLKTMARNIAVDADWHRWPAEYRPDWMVTGNHTPLSRIDIADIAVAREALKKPHDYSLYLSHWISERGDLDLARHLYATGQEKWQSFALLHLGRGVEMFFARGGLLREATNWPGRVLEFVRPIAAGASTIAGLPPRARAIVAAIEHARDRHVETARRNALRPFQA